jgi:hypothetical protein
MLSVPVGGESVSVLTGVLAQLYNQV